MLLSLFCPWLLLTQIWRMPPPQFLFLFCHWMILILFSRMLPPKFRFPVQLEQFHLVLVCHWLFLEPHLRNSLFCFQIVRILLYMDFHWCFSVQIYCLRGRLFFWMILISVRVIFGPPSGRGALVVVCVGNIPVADDVSFAQVLSVVCSIEGCQKELVLRLESLGLGDVFEEGACACQQYGSRRSGICALTRKKKDRQSFQLQSVGRTHLSVSLLHR